METPFLCTSAEKIHRFKSYYVVWKPEEIEADEDGEDGLNRTMQYGNDILGAH